MRQLKSTVVIAIVTVIQCAKAEKYESEPVQHEQMKADALERIGAICAKRECMPSPHKQVEPESPTNISFLYNNNDECIVTASDYRCTLDCSSGKLHERAQGVFVNNYSRAKGDPFYGEEWCGNRRLAVATMAPNQSPYYFSPGEQISPACKANRYINARAAYVHHAVINYLGPEGAKLHFHGFRYVRISKHETDYCISECGDDPDHKSRSNRPRIFDDNTEDDTDMAMLVRSCDGVHTAKLHIGGPGEPATRQTFLVAGVSPANNQNDPVVCEYDTTPEGYVVVYRENQCGYWLRVDEDWQHRPSDYVHMCDWESDHSGGC